MTGIGSIISLLMPLILGIIKLLFGIDKPEIVEIINDNPIVPKEKDILDSLGLNIKP
jgi:hypothetical protein